MKILLLGSNGQLGTELKRQLPDVGRVKSLPESSLDITNHTAVKNAVSSINPNIIVNAAAYTAVDKAEKDSENAFAINSMAVANLAQLANVQNAWLIHYSTDYVFDGTKPTPYIETDPTHPINVYGASKLGGEQAIAAASCKHLILRTTWVIGKDGNNFAKTILRLAKERSSLNVINDQLGVPTSTSLISKVTIDALQSIKNDCAWPQGLYHLSPQGVTNWHEIALTLVNFADQNNVRLSLNSNSIKPITTEEYPTPARRPLNSQLDTQKLRKQLAFNLPYWKDDFLPVADEICKELLLV